MSLTAQRLSFISALYFCRFIVILLGIIMKAFVTVPLVLMSENSTKPIDYLTFARQDLVERDTRALINALGNIKRAIECQLDVFLEMYGLLKLSMKEKWAFPKKIDVVRKIGIVAPSILKLINSKRNKMEHYHKKPRRKEVVEFLDVAELFIELFKHTTHRIELLVDYKNDYAIQLDTNRNQISVYENAELIGKHGGIEFLKSGNKDQITSPIQVIGISDLEAWTDACGRYLRI